MRGLVALYAVICEEEGTTSNSELLQFFRKVDMVEERASTAPISTESAPPPEKTADDDARAASWCYMRAAFPDTLTVGGEAKYLGDAGTAAVFRMLPFMRWVRRVEAQATGAGTRTVAALCHALTLDEAVTVSVADPGNEVGGHSHAEVTLTLPAVPLEHVDLRGNAIFAMSARDILRALRKRQALVVKAQATLATAGPHAVAQHGASLPAPPTLLLDTDALPATAAKALHRLNEDAASAVRRRQAEAARAWELLQRSLFCVPAARGGRDGAGSGPPRTRPTGERVIYRVPERSPSLPPQTSEPVDTQDARGGDAEGTRVAFTEASSTSAAALAREVNQCMESYLFAHRCFAGRDALNSAREGRPAPAHAAAAQLCIDVGADTLSHLPRTHAVVWLTLNVERQGCHEGSGKEKEEDLPIAERREREEVLFGVGRLLRGFLSNPTLEQEMCEAAPSPLAPRHLERMRELYYALTWGRRMRGDSRERKERGPSRGIPLDSVRELRGLYLRVVSALVAKPFSAAWLPSLAGAEQRIADTRHYLVDVLLEGKPLMCGSGAATRSTVSKSLLDTLRETVPIQEATRSLPLLSTAMKYFTANHKEACASWNASYTGGGGGGGGSSREAAGDRPSSSAEDDALLDPNLRPFVTCTCAEMVRSPSATPPETDDSGSSSQDVDSRSGGSGGDRDEVVATPSRPCPACCHVALSALHAILRSDYAQRREALLAPLRLYLPREVRLFLLEMVLEKASRRQRGWAGSAYVPALCGGPSSLEAFTASQQGRAADQQQKPITAMGSALRGTGMDAPAAATAASAQEEGDWASVVELFASVGNSRERLGDFCSAFAEWYRLKAIENYGDAEL